MNSKITRNFSSAVLLAFAYIIMIVDHIGAGPVAKYMKVNGIARLELYTYLRLIGRMAFPIFVFMCVEGTLKTRSRCKYLRNILITAIVTEPFFDFFAHDTWFFPKGNNVLFNLALAVAAVWLYEIVGDRFKQKTVTKVILYVLITVVLAMAGMLLFFDYGAIAVFLAAAFYFNRGNYLRMCLFVILSLFVGRVMGVWYHCVVFYDKIVTDVHFLMDNTELEMYAAFGLIPIFYYDGTRGRRLPKWITYSIYPAQYLILGIVDLFIK